MLQILNICLSVAFTSGASVADEASWISRQSWHRLELVHAASKTQH